uniref:Uncharacterized protein n=1 Tax=Leersia perrieri TaxID=77586 RepID=A0A0D9WUQ7_9ORYZ
MAPAVKTAKDLAIARVIPLHRIYDFLEIEGMALPHEWIWRCSLAGIFFASLVTGSVAADQCGKWKDIKQRRLSEAENREAERAE